MCSIGRFLEKLREFHHALEEEVPYLKKITSLINVRETRGEGDQLIVEDLLKEIPESPEAMAELKKRVLSSKLYPNYYISEDGTLTAVFIETVPYSPEKGGGDLAAGFKEEEGDKGDGASDEPTPLTGAENSEVIRAVEKVAARFEAPGFPIHFAGSPVLLDFYRALIARDVGKFMSLAFLAFTVFLLYLFRRISGALMPLMVVVLSMLSTLSLMAIFGAPFTMVTSILPSFMMSVGVGSSVHILAIFYRRFRETGDKEEAIVYTFGHSGLPVFMTSITTAVGLLSFSTAAMAPVADLGIFGGMGVLVILLFILVLMPALIAVLPLPRSTRFEGKKPGQMAGPLPDMGGPLRDPQALGHHGREWGNRDRCRSWAILSGVRPQYPQVSAVRFRSPPDRFAPGSENENRHGLRSGRGCRL